MNTIEIVILVFAPVIYALYNGRNGISHPAVKQVLWVTIIMMSCAIGISTYELATQWPVKMASLRWVHIKCLAVSITGYGLFFNPLMNYQMLYRGRGAFKIRKFYWSDVVYCFDHVSDTAIPDKWKWYRALGWKGRLVGYAVLFLSAVLWFTWDSFRSLESYLH